MVSEIRTSADYRIEFRANESYLYVRVEGLKDGAEISKKYWKEILDESRERKVNGLLVEVKLTDTMSAAEVYEIAKFVAETAPDGTRIAYVDRRHYHQELNRFGNLVANNRGLNSRVFDSVDEAEIWLLAN